MTRSPLPDELKPKLGEIGLGGMDPAIPQLFSFDKGEYLSHEGEIPEYLLFIIRGTVKISVSNGAGRTMMFCFDRPGDIIGSIELLPGIPFTATSQAVTPVQCIAVAMQQNMAFFNTDVGFLHYLCTDLSNAFSRSSKNAATNILYPLQTRLSSYISLTAQDGLFCEKLTETSELLGTSYRHLLRCLDKLCQDGVLEKQPRGYRVNNPAALQAMAEDYYLLR